jgi:hypothetical protein
LTAALALALAIAAAPRGARAWDPPDGPAADQVTQPATPETLLPKAHGYIIQNGISVLYNDGYWFAAEKLRQWQPELLNGVRWADVYQGDQEVDLQLCEIEGLECQTLDNIKSWPYAADNHYFNPDTGLGLQPGFLSDAATWGPFIPPILLGEFTLGLLFVTVDVNPSLDSVYPTSLSWLDREFGNAVGAYQGQSPPSINGRSGTQLAMFYLGWASHFMQDQTVVHHTFDQPLMHHSEYEATADGYVTSAPLPGEVAGIYSVPARFCTPGAASCFASFADVTVHDAATLTAIDDAGGNYPNAMHAAITLAEGLQAGLYAAFFTAAGEPPVHMSAIMPLLM